MRGQAQRKPSEAEGVGWLKRALRREGLRRRPVATLRASARQNGIGLVRVAPSELALDEEPAPPRPDPRSVLATRRYLIGTGTARSLLLNRPLHYLAALVASCLSPAPVELLLKSWGLAESAARGALRGAETLGLVAVGIPTTRGRAYADLARALGFDL